MSCHAFKRTQTQRGVAMVEFAIVLPLLLLMLLAVGEFGRMLYQYNSLLQASRDASRFVAGKAWNATLGQIELSGDLQTQTKNVAVYGVPSNQAGFPPVVSGLTTADVAVSSVGAEHVQVSITFTFCPVIGSGNCGGSIPGFFGDAIALNIPLVATTIMRAL
ncbi:TadE/TadG family type IV pilus assembly protein [Pseudomonas sp.]|uniref:TadE/TadG family type IV pilus assembly protein n=1 Tax=Pseudomonas sp. TaxID=306 RepID=UPI0027367D00|nr:TadE family protein [Pseudomonas sp.]MDP3816039.1 pilus assembly protein [Pseudomonas sp.]